MTLAELIQKKSECKPPRILIHGKHGIGKSSWAVVSPNPIFVQTEDGLSEIEVDRFPLSNSVTGVFGQLIMLAKEDHDYKTIVIDTLDWFEKLVFEQVCKENKVESIEKIGYSKGYVYALKYHNELIEHLNLLRLVKNMAIILICHNEIKTFSNPEGEDYDQYVLKLHKKAAALYEEYVDAIFFINQKVFIDVRGEFEKNKGISSGERSLFTDPRPSFSAKCRFYLPFEIPFNKGDGFNTILNYINNNKNKELKNE